MKTISKKFHGVYVKKNRYFLKFYDGNQNMFANAWKGVFVQIVFFFFFMMLPKNIHHMGLKLQGRVKSSILFNWTHVFMYLTHFIQVA